MVAFLLRRLKTGLSAREFLIVLATTNKKEDNAVAECGTREGVNVVRGAENDVIKRYIQCLKKYPADIVVRVTADNPFTCPDVIMQAVRTIKLKKCEYLICMNLPKGAGVDVFSANLLKEIEKSAKDPREREHINLFVLRHKENYKIAHLGFKVMPGCLGSAFTVDTKTDFDSIKAILRKSDSEPWTIPLDEAVRRMGASAFR